MATDLAYRSDAPPQQRLAAFFYEKAFGCAPFGVWYAPYSFALLADGERQLTVTAPWGSFVAASPRSDDLIEPVHASSPDQRVTLTVGEAAAGGGPSWASDGLRAARAGVTLLVSTDLPEGSGLRSPAATQSAIRLALDDLAALTEPTARPEAGRLEEGRLDTSTASPEPGFARLDGRHVPFDLAAAGLRLVLIDTRVRDVPQPPAAEHAPMDAVAAAVAAGALSELGPMLTAVHRALASGEAQQVAVCAALGAGALGARMVVDGPGRPACALVPLAVLPDLRAALTRAFAARGLRTPRTLTVSPVADRPRRIA